LDKNLVLRELTKFKKKIRRNNNFFTDNNNISHKALIYNIMRE